MAFACNINRRGQRIRLVNGIILVAVALVLAWAWCWGSGSIARWAIAAVAGLGGAFCIFEGAIGWCAIRAMGIKTKI